ncbi:MAG: DUF5688 family protein [Clostridiales bacterium]|nr:DUF5688 family protein [Clostridiales bacterium]
MSDREWSELVQQELSRKLGDQGKAEIHRLTGNNGKIRDVVCILTRGERMTPVIDLQPYYEQLNRGEDLQAVAQQIFLLYQSCGQPPANLPSLDTWEEAKLCLGARIISAGENEKYLEDAPHRRFLDLALVYYLLVEDGADFTGTVRITNEMMEKWQVCEKDIYEQSLWNLPKMLPVAVMCLDEMMKKLWQLGTGGMIPGEAPEQSIFFDKESSSKDNRIPVYVVTNKRQYMGAIALFYEGVLDRFLEDMDWEKVWILPSSIHEMLLVQADDWNDAGKLAEMVEDVNETVVEKEDRLSYSVYQYSREERILRRVTGKEEKVIQIFGLDCAAIS